MNGDPSYLNMLEFFACNKWRSKSQISQDLLVLYFSQFKKDGFFVEIGAADGWYSRLVFNEVKKLTLSDFDEIWLDDFKSQDIYRKSETKYLIHDFVSSPLDQVFDGIYGLDVLEHIKPIDQSNFLTNVCASLLPQGVAIFGMPSAESQVYASEGSKIGHVNCQSGEELKNNLKRHFENVFIFSMSDEVVHTGFMPMAHYLIALCTGPFNEEINK